MKIYHYDKFYKFYTHSENIVDRIEGQGLPASSTEIPPPLDQCQEDEIPIFSDGEWLIVEDRFWRPQIVEVNYDAGRSISDFHFEDLSYMDFPVYPEMPQLCNTQLVVQKIIQSIRVVNKKFLKSLSLLKKCHDRDDIQILDSPKRNDLVLSPTTLYEYKCEVESLVFIMRRIIDSLVQLTDLLVNFDAFVEKKKLYFESIGSTFASKNSDQLVTKIIMGGDQYERDETNFLPVINQLFNAFKHTLMHDETTTWMREDGPTILCLSVKYSDYKKEITYHNHNAYHIMMGFQDCIKRILANQKKYIALQQI
ncbi:hypothetical protein [Desulfopila sp. IMCC35008]|uniref:hypothetical protein n=1 Tax=Desulfopila sp. IMCC35008 TaxID=2653858 RepID=UPI0013D731D7|nr:hypothetical protein [Desulfopila sp. IMCC35008]